MGLFPVKCAVLAGSWPQNSSMVVGERMVFYTDDPAKGEIVELSQVASVELATEETVQKLGSTVGLGLLGTALLGPVGLVGGVLMARKKKATFVLRLRDGREALIDGEQSVYKQLNTAGMQNLMNATARLN